MNNPKNNTQSPPKQSPLPFVFEFLKFSLGFVAIIMLGLASLSYANAAFK